MLSARRCSFVTPFAEFAALGHHCVGDEAVKPADVYVRFQVYLDVAHFGP